MFINSTRAPTVRKTTGVGKITRKYCLQPDRKICWVPTWLKLELAPIFVIVKIAIFFYEQKFGTFLFWNCSSNCLKLELAGTLKLLKSLSYECFSNPQSASLLPVNAGQQWTLLSCQMLSKAKLKTFHGVEVYSCSRLHRFAKTKIVCWWEELG